MKEALMEPRAYSYFDRLKLIVGDRLETFPKDVREWAKEKQKPVEVLAKRYRLSEEQAVVLQQTLFLMHEVGNGLTWLNQKPIPANAKQWVHTPEVQELRRYGVEHLLLLVPNQKSYSSHLLSVGNADYCLIPHPDEILDLVQKLKGDSFVLVHNHPDDFASPSPEDWIATETLIQAIACSEFTFLDHIIITPSNHWYSMRRNGVWNEVHECVLVDE